MRARSAVGNRLPSCARTSVADQLADMSRITRRRTQQSPACSVRNAGELRAGVLQLAGPLAGPAKSAGGLAAHVGGRCTAGEVDVLTPVHPPRVGAAGVAREVPGQLTEEPVHDLCPPAVPP